MTQDRALEILKTGANVFLTGEPGAGKTHTINRYIEWLRSNGVYPAVTASTGIASTHINGTTIHSWCGIGIHRNLTDEQIERITDKPWVYDKVNKTKVLIIDEISMLDAVTIDDVDRTITRIKADLMSEKPFGGMQVIFVGDFFQLPPVQSDPKEKVKFAFEAKAWEAARPVFCYLSEQHRQEDPVYLEILTRMRRGELTKEHKDILSIKNRPMMSSVSYITKLYTHNAAVDSINDNELRRLETQRRDFGMETSGNDFLVATLKKHCLSPEMLKLKVGARVMFTRNNFDENYVNGTLGEVTGFSYDGFPTVKIKDGRVITVRYADWTIMEGKEVLACISQIPLRLAWAITVHKSQGMSLDGAVIDLSKAFEYGQGYVALSRVRSLSGLILEGFNDRALEMHPKIVEVDTSFRIQSETLDIKYAELSPEWKARLAQEFLDGIR